MPSLQGARTTIASTLSRKSSRSTKSKKTATDQPPLNNIGVSKTNGPVNLYQPLGGIPEPIIRSLKHGWRLAQSNAAATLWSHRDPRVVNPPTTTAAPSVHPFTSHRENVEEKPDWYDHFHIGARSNQAKNHAARAKLLAGTSESDWTTKDIKSLIYAFIGYASTSMVGAECDDSLASFLKQVVLGFEKINSNLYGKVVDQFSDELVETFLACWDPKCGWSISQRGNEVDVYVPAAVNLTKFMGDCLKYGLLSASEVRACIRVLMSHATHLEHLDAIYFITLRAGPTLWPSTNRAEDVAKFLLTLRYDILDIDHDRAWTRESRCLEGNNKMDLYDAISANCNACVDP